MVTSCGWHDGPVGESEKPQDWTALARAVTDRRVELGHRTLRSFAQASGLSTKTLGEIEGAKRLSYDRATLIQVERSLQWPSGAVEAVLAGRPAPGEWKFTQHVTMAGSVAHRTDVRATDDVDVVVVIGEPTEEKLHRLAVFLPTLNPRDHAWLRETLDNLLEWAGAHAGRPELTAQQEEDRDLIQATFAASNERRRAEGGPQVPPGASGRTPSRAERS